MSSNNEWADITWNPVTGCTRCSLGCQNCYAERAAVKYQAEGSPRYKDGFKVTLHRHVIGEPYTWREPRTVALCTMGDIFHPEVPDEFLGSIFRVIKETPKHTYILLTKRPERMAQFHLPVLPNLWAGVTVEHPQYWNLRVPFLLEFAREAAVRFVSVEPMLADMGRVDLTGIDWVICGGETGPGARPVHPDWVRRLRDQVKACGLPFFFKQWGNWGQTCTIQPPTWAPPLAGVLQSAVIKGDPALGVLGKKCYWAYPQTQGPVACLEPVGRDRAGKLLDGETYFEVPSVRAVAQGELFG